MISLFRLCLLGVVAVQCVLAYPYASQGVYARAPAEAIPGHGAADFLSASFQSLPDFAEGAFYVKSTTSATFQLAAKEYEQPLSQIISVYDHTQNKAKDIVHAESILDNTKEKDKYGNSGDQHAKVGRFVVNTVEGVSNFINKLFDLPITGQRLIGRGVTDKLNQIGAKLVGL